MNGKKTLVLLVGSNPLPNYLAAATLKPARVVLLFTPATLRPKERLTRALQERLGVATVDERQIEDAGSAASVRYACKGQFTDAHLNYTGGTKVMAAVARMVFGENGGDPKDASYVDESDGRLRFDDESRTIPLLSSALNLPTLLALHGVAPMPGHEQLPHDPTDNDADVLARWTLDDPSRAATLYGFTNPENKKGKRVRLSFKDFQHQPLMEPVFPSRARLPGDGWTPEEGKRWIEFLGGQWLDQWVGAKLREVAKECAIHVGVNLRLHQHFERDTELDVLLIRGHRLHLVSCTTDRTVSMCKSKLFEAALRAQQIGGDLARCALACFLAPGADADKVRADVTASWGERNTPEVFDHSHLRAWCGLDGPVDLSSLERWIQG